LFSKHVFIRVLCIAEFAGRCSKSGLEALEQILKAASQDPPEKKLRFFESVITEMALHDADAAIAVASEFFKAAQRSETAAAQLFYDVSDSILKSYPNVIRLKACIEKCAATKPDLARAIVRNAPLIASSIIT